MHIKGFGSFSFSFFGTVVEGPFLFFQVWGGGRKSGRATCDLFKLMQFKELKNKIQKMTKCHKNLVNP